jgi:hypothetical protein
MILAFVKYKRLLAGVEKSTARLSGITRRCQKDTNYQWFGKINPCNCQEPEITLKLLLQFQLYGLQEFG